MMRMAFLMAASFMLGAALTVVVVKGTTSKPAPIVDIDPYAMSFAQLSSDLNNRQGDLLDHYALYYLSSIDQSTIAILRKIHFDAKHGELRAYADQLVQRRTDEVDQLFAWQKTWGYSHH